MLFLLLPEGGAAQTKQEVAEWLSGRGEEYLQEITGNSSIYWEVESNGTFKITNHKTDSSGAEEVIRRYTYLNVYDLDSEDPLITGDGQSKELVLSCKPEAYSCIRTRHYYTNTEFDTEAASSLLFDLEKEFDDEKGKELEMNLLLIIQLVNGKNPAE